MKYKKIPIEVDAIRWFKYGDHVSVSRYAPINAPGMMECGWCKKQFYEHGAVVSMEGTVIVCPGDWIIQGIKGELYPCKADIFELTYEAV